MADDDWSDADEAAFALLSDRQKKGILKRLKTLWPEDPPFSVHQDPKTPPAQPEAPPHPGNPSILETLTAGQYLELKKLLTSEITPPTQSPEMKPPLEKSTLQETAVPTAPKPPNVVAEKPKRIKRFL